MPFSDPMADGLAIQRCSRAALQQGASLKWILNTLTEAKEKPKAPLVLMSYLNPLPVPYCHGLACWQEGLYLTDAPRR